MSVKCFDVVSMVVEEASKQFAPLWQIDEERYAILKNYCTAFDKLAKEFEAEAFEVSIDDMLMTVTIAIESPSMTVQDDPHLFYELIRRAISVRFSESGENVAAAFEFPSLWCRAHRNDS